MTMTAARGVNRLNSSQPSYRAPAFRINQAGVCPRGVEAAALDDNRGAVERRARPRNHVDDREERTVAMKGGRWPADDFDPLEHRRVQAELRADLRLSVHVVVDTMSVHQQQNATVVVAKFGKPPSAQIAVVAAAERSALAAPLRPLDRRGHAR
jgi:hypothetical protein